MAAAGPLAEPPRPPRLLASGFLSCVVRVEAPPAAPPLLLPLTGLLCWTRQDPVTCAAWFPDGRRLATGSHDKQLCVVALDGTVERQWRIQRVQEVLVVKGGRYILVSPNPGRGGCTLFILGSA